MNIIGVTQSIVNHIRDQIISGEFKPGQKLNEVEIANSLNVSRPPLREAFRILEHEQLVTNIPRKGTYITELSRENLDDIYRTREMIECFAIDTLEAKNIKDFYRIEKALGSISQTDPINKIAYLEAFNRFHINLVEEAGNPLLVHFYRAIHSNLARYQFFFLNDISRFSQEDHREIYCLLKNGEYGKSKELLKMHIRKFVQFAVVKSGEQTFSFDSMDPQTA
jgi:DNA-binding GntR family transcriptional regulator